MYVLLNLLTIPFNSLNRNEFTHFNFDTQPNFKKTNAKRIHLIQNDNCCNICIRKNHIHVLMLLSFARISWNILMSHFGTSFHFTFNSNVVIFNLSCLLRVVWEGVLQLFTDVKKEWPQKRRRGDKCDIFYLNQNCLIFLITYLVASFCQIVLPGLILLSSFLMSFTLVKHL